MERQMATGDSLKAALVQGHNHHAQALLRGLLPEAGIREEVFAPRLVHELYSAHYLLTLVNEKAAHPEAVLPRKHIDYFFYWLFAVTPQLNRMPARHETDELALASKVLIAGLDNPEFRVIVRATARLRPIHKFTKEALAEEVTRQRDKLLKKAGFMDYWRT
jgi:hypothetical protein